MREVEDTIGEMGEVRDVVGCGGAADAEEGRSLSTAWVEPQQPCQKVLELLSESSWR